MSKIDYKKLEGRLNKMKQYKFVEKYLSDTELEGLFNEYTLAEIPEVRWPLLVVDEVFARMKK